MSCLYLDGLDSGVPDYNVSFGEDAIGVETGFTFTMSYLWSKSSMYLR